MNKAKNISKFKNEAEERTFCESHDSSGFVNWNKAALASFANLKPSTKTISLRLPESLLDRIKIEANRVCDDLVLNDWGGIHHKSYGYLRTPEFTDCLKNFI